MAEEKKPIILVPTDFSAAAANAVEHAVGIAKRSGDEVRLIHIVDSNTRTRLKKEGKSLDDLHAQLKKEEDRIAAQGVKAGSHLREGSIFDTIGEVAREVHARLMVMGTHGVVGMQHITGAWAVKVMTSSPVPTVVVQKKSPGAAGYRNIVFPIGPEKETKQKVIHTISLAKYFGSDVHLFATNESDEFINNALKNNIAWAENTLKRNGVDYDTTHSEKGNYIKQLIKFSAQVNADMIVILTESSEINVSDFILGADNEKIINNDAQIPVLCVNPIAELYNIGNVLFQ